jgi:hypothetical protein
LVRILERFFVDSLKVREISLVVQGFAKLQRVLDTIMDQAVFEKHLLSAHCLALSFGQSKHPLAHPEAE